MKKNKKFLLLQRIKSFLVDFLMILSISFLLKGLLSRFFDISNLICFLIAYPSYYLLHCFYHGQTFGKILTGIKIVSNRSERLTCLQIFLRDIIGKYLLLVVIPTLLISQISFPIDILLLIGGGAYFIVITLLTLIIFPIFIKKAFWDFISLTALTKVAEENKQLRLKTLIVVVGFYFLTITLKTYPFIIEPQRLKNEFYPEYINNSKIKEYSNYVLSNSQEPVDYILGLFEKYDLVVLCERAHAEYTQYDLIKDILKDKRFVENVGNLYTECGSSSFQDSLESYLRTDFQNEDSLNIATSILQRNSNAVWPLWSNTNLFDLLKTVNKLNSNLEDSLKLNWYFTDIPVDWQSLSPSNYRQHLRKKSRDKVMAENIYRKYQSKISTNEKRVKGLVIMNFRHGFGRMINEEIASDRPYPKSTNTTAILMDSLPNKVCNVMLNTISFKYGTVFTPVQNGKWDKAFKDLNNPNIGFDFSDSPFGNDEFDMFIVNQSKGLRYKDVFDGFVFYKPLSEHIYKTGFPYMLDNFEDTLIRRAACISPDYSLKWSEQISNYKEGKLKKRFIQMPELINLCNGHAEYATLNNLIVNIGLSFAFFLILVIILIDNRRMIFKK